MNTEIAVITGKLRSMGVDPTVLKMVREGVKKAQSPQLDQSVIERLRETVANSHRAILVLSAGGKYSVFSPEGHASLRASAKKHQPWVASKKHRAKKTSKHLH